METEVQPQATGEAQVQPAGAEAPQSVEQAPVAEQPGAETETKPEAPAAVKPSKVYTEDEVRQRESGLTSKLQAETEQMRRYAGQMALAQEIQQLAQAEHQAQGKDQQEVANGVITETEAGQRKGQRIQALQSQAQVAQMQGVLRGQMAQGEQIGRITMAHDLATKYGINPERLLKDASIRTPMDMIQKATDLALADRDAKLRTFTVKSETFDKGAQGESTGPTSYEDSLRSRYPTMYPKR